MDRWVDGRVDDSIGKLQNDAGDDCTQVQGAEEDQGERKRSLTLTLKFGSVYHVINNTCIHHEGSRPEYIHVQVLENMHKTPYTMGKLQSVHIHLTHLTS